MCLHEGKKSHNIPENTDVLVYSGVSSLQSSKDAIANLGHFLPVLDNFIMVPESGTLTVKP